MSLKNRVKKMLTRIRFVSLVSSAGNGVYTARATQLPRMVSRIKNSKGFHSTIWKKKSRIESQSEMKIAKI